MCSCDFEPPSFRAVVFPKARKVHACAECGGAIVPGEQYERVTFGFEGTVETWKVCLACREWSRALCDAQREMCGCSGYEVGALWRAIAEFVEEHLSAAAFAHRAREAARAERMRSVVMS